MNGQFVDVLAATPGHPQLSVTVEEGDPSDM